MIKAITSPICRLPLVTCFPPNQRTATMEQFIMVMVIGCIKIISRAAFLFTRICSSLATVNLCFSRSPRTKAFTTRTPLRFSLITPLTLSSFSWTRWKRGSPLRIIKTTLKKSKGRATTRIRAILISISKIINRLPAASKGARTSMRRDIMTIIWTCVTSLVNLVISDSVLNLSRAAKESSWILWYNRKRKSVAKFMAVTVEAIPQPQPPARPIKAIPIINAPYRKTKVKSPRATPSSTILAIIAGCKRSPATSIIIKTGASKAVFQYGLINFSSLDKKNTSFIQRQPGEFMAVS